MLKVVFVVIDTDIFVAIYRALGWIFDGCLEWLTYVVQYGFPLYNLFLFGFAAYCIRGEINGYLKSVEGIYRCDCKVAGQDTTNFTCDQAFALSAFTMNEIVDVNSSELRFDCEDSFEPLRIAKFDVDKARKDIQDRINEIYRDTLNLTEKDATATFLRDKNYYCLQTENWIDEVEYRSSL